MGHAEEWSRWLRAEAEEAVVETFADDGDDPDPVRARVLRVQNHVPGAEHNCRRNAG